MMLRYIAAAGDGASLRMLERRLASSGACALQPVLQEPELAMWVVEGTPHIRAQDGSAAVAGLLFEQAGDRQVRSLPEALPSPEEFVARYWGVYVLFGKWRADGHVLLRDPSGGMTAYHRRCGALDIYTSDAVLLTQATADPLEPDAEFLRQWLTFSSFRGRLTGARDVTEVVPGSFRRTSGGQEEIELAWSPWDHALRGGTIEDFDAAAGLLRAAILRTAPRMVGANMAVLRLSGGLDSSILAAALAHGDRTFHAVTFATRAPEGDERLHARAVAAHLGRDLAEFTEEGAPCDLVGECWASLRPPTSAVTQPFQRALAEHIALAGADLVVDGAGGDNVFCHIPSASPALDAVNLRGVRAGLAALDDLARLHATTAWAVARAAWRRARKPPVSWLRDEQFLAPAAQPARSIDHPWLEHPAGAPRGTLEHVQSIVGIQFFLSDPLPGMPATLHPLLAQPVLEVCLRIPTWLWIHNGRDRAVARAAFEGLLPRATLSRRSKGHLASLFLKRYTVVRPQIESLLLDGRLAAMGLLDCDAIRQYLRREGQPSDSGYMRLLDFASAELWLRGFDC